MGFEDLRHTEDESASVETHRSPTTPEVGGEIADRLAEQATEDTESLTKVRGELQELPASSEPLYKPQDLAEVTAAFQETLRAKGETCKFTPDQINELSRFIKGYIVRYDRFLTEKGAFEKLELSVGVDAASHREAYNAKLKRIKTLLTKVVPALEWVAPPTTIVGTALGGAYLQPGLAGGIGLGIAALGALVYLAANAQNSIMNFAGPQSYPMLSRFLQRTYSTSLDQIVDRHDEASSLTFLQNSGELEGIVEKLRQTKCFTTLGTLSQTLESVTSSGVDNEVKAEARKTYSREVLETIEVSLKEIGLQFNEADMEILKKEAEHVRSRKDSEARERAEHSTAQAQAAAELEAHGNSAAVSQFTTAVENANRQQEEVSSERAKAEEELKA